MTPPREPDRFEAKAGELLRLLAGDPDYEPELAPRKLAHVAAALRAAEASALERAAQGCAEKARDYARRAAGQHSYGDPEEAHPLEGRASAWRDAESLCRALATSPEAPPAKEPCRAEVASRFPEYSHYECELPGGHVGPHSEGGTEWTDATTVVAPPSEPVAPAPSDLPIDAGRKMVAEAKAVSALGESLLRAEKRIAELEAVYRMQVQRDDLHMALFQAQALLITASQATSVERATGYAKEALKIVDAALARTASPGKEEL